MTRRGKCLVQLAREHVAIEWNSNVDKVEAYFTPQNLNNEQSNAQHIPPRLSLFVTPCCCTSNLNYIHALHMIKNETGGKEKKDKKKMDHSVVGR